MDKMNPRFRPAGGDVSNRPLRICMLSYRSNPHCGGQGVYLKNLSRALTDLGHQVEVISGPPDPMLDPDIKVTRLPCLDLYDPADPFRMPTLKELANPVNLLEWLGVSTMGFPEPLTFGVRAFFHLKHRFHQFDVVHDNQSLSYGVWAIGKHLPTLATIHHPITVDRAIAIAAVSAMWKKMQQFRWFSFLPMQKRVSRTLGRIITVSDCAKQDIIRDFAIRHDRFSVVPNGINTDLFKAPARGGSQTRPNHHHHQFRRAPQGAVLPAQGRGQRSIRPETCAWWWWEPPGKTGASSV